MEVYQLENIDENNILLHKIIIDINQFTITKQKNDDILLIKIKNININNIEDLKQHDFKKSIILKCTINNSNIQKLKYKSILNNVYYLINDGYKIIKITKLNIKTTKKIDNGFYFIDNLGISVQGVDSTKCLLEIFNQCYHNNISLYIKIKLHNNITIIINN